MAKSCPERGDGGHRHKRGENRLMRILRAAGWWWIPEQGNPGNGFWPKWTGAGVLACRAATTDRSRRTGVGGLTDRIR